VSPARCGFGYLLEPDLFVTGLRLNAGIRAVVTWRLREPRNPPRPAWRSSLAVVAPLDPLSRRGRIEPSRAISRRSDFSAQVRVGSSVKTRRPFRTIEPLSSDASPQTVRDNPRATIRTPQSRGVTRVRLAFPPPSGTVISEEGAMHREQRAGGRSRDR